MKENIVGLNEYEYVMNYTARKFEKKFVLIVENFLYILIIIQAHTFVRGTDV